MQIMPNKPILVQMTLIDVLRSRGENNPADFLQAKLFPGGPVQGVARPNAQ